MNVFVSRDGQTFGPYTVEQATEFLQVGQLLATDFALYEGESEWKTLGNLLGATEQQSIVSPVAQPHQPKKSAPLENSKTIGQWKAKDQDKDESRPICSSCKTERFRFSYYINPYRFFSHLYCGLRRSCRTLFCFSKQGQSDHEKVWIFKSGTGS
jgi:hypothetical protein